MRTLQVYQPNAITGILEMKFPTGQPAEVSGIQALLQNIVLFLRTKPGTDAFSPDRGSVLGDPASISKALQNPNQLKVLITDAVDRAKVFIIDQQSKQRANGQYLSPEETLSDIEVNDIYQGDDPTTIYVELLVYSNSNQQYFLTV